MDSIKTVKMVKVKRDFINEPKNIEDTLTIEHELTLNINDKVMRNMICTNTAIKELIYGHLYTQGYIKSVNDIEKIEIANDNKNAFVKLNDSNDINLASRIKNLDIVTTGASYKDVSQDKNVSDLNDNVDDYNIESITNLEKIMENSKYILEANELFKQTGCLHSAAIAFDNVIKYYEADLGRHNAVDKVIGHCLINGDKLENAVLYTTGRIPTDMINKVVKAGIKMVVTRAAVTFNAVRIARANGIRLIGFSRGESMNIYS